MELSEKIQSLRKKKGMSQEALAEKLNVSRQAVSKWELGVSVPDVDKIALGNYAVGHIAIGNSVNGVKEMILQDANFSDMDVETVRRLIQQEFPKTWKWILKLFTMW